MDTAFELGAPVPVGQMLLHLYRLGVAQGWGDEDISAIAKVLEHLNPKADGGGGEAEPWPPPLFPLAAPFSHGRRNHPRGHPGPAAARLFSRHS